jgi:hypothetical protein
MWLLRPLPMLVVSVCLCLAVAGGITLLGDGGGPLTRPATRPATAPATGAATLAPAALDPSPVTARTPDRPPVRAVEVLEKWDRARAAAYSSGDVPALRRLYVAGAPPGRHDVRMLREYVERGLVVRDLVLQRSEVEVLSSAGRRLRVAVTERLAAATVVAADGEVALPADRLERRVVTLLRRGERWQVAAVVAVTRPDAARPGSGR